MDDNANFDVFLEELLRQPDTSIEAMEPQEEGLIDQPAENFAAPVRVRNPFKFLDAYTEADRDIFFGRELEIRELYHTVFSNKVSVVFGNSGAGKTSLVQCGFFSQIKPEKAVYFAIRSAIDPLASILEDVVTKSGIHSNDGLFDGLVQTVHALKRTVILFFDQFEELFIYQPPAIRKELALLFQKIIRSDLDIRIIIGIREEYFARLIELEKVVPEILLQRVWVRKMSGMQAEMVIQNACKVCGVGLEEGVAGAVAAALSQGKEGIELPYVQVVMDALYSRVVQRNPDLPKIELADIEIQGGVGNILNNFIENQISGMSQPETARQILKALVTSEGTKRTAHLDDIADMAAMYGERIDPDVLKNNLQDLVTRRILREDPDKGLFELRHDSLVLTIRQWMTGLEQELMEVRQTLDSRFKEYQTRGTVLDSGLLKYIAPYESRLRLRLEMLAFIHKSKEDAERKRKTLMAVVGSAIGVFVIVVSVLGVFGYLQSIAADKNALEANRQQILAEQKAAEAKDQLIEARHNLGYVFFEKAKQVSSGKVYNPNALILYSLHAMANFDPNQTTPEKSIATGMVGAKGYPTVFSSRNGSHHNAPVTSVSFSPDGRTLASGSWDK
ncbi:MAG: hypothetical protein WCR46_10080, partial [Deltaproteobacteria bacterium]